MSTQSATVLIVNLASRNATVNKKYGPWSKRAIKAALFIRARGADFVVCQELYAEHRDDLMKLLPGYVVDGVRGGRVIIRRRASWIAVVGGSFWTDLLPGKGTKYAIARKYKFLHTGAILNLANAHVSWETSNVGINRRAREIPALVKWLRSKFPKGYDLYAGDFNAPYKSTTRRDDVGPIFTRNGLHDLANDVTPKPLAGPRGYHLLRAFAGKIKATAITIHPNDFTDHPAIRVTIAIPA